MDERQPWERATAIEEQAARALADRDREGATAAEEEAAWAEVRRRAWALTILGAAAIAAVVVMLRLVTA